MADYARQTKELQFVHRSADEQKREVRMGRTPLGFNSLDVWDEESAESTRGAPALGEITTGSNGACWIFLKASEEIAAGNRCFLAYNPDTMLAQLVDADTPDGYPLVLTDNIGKRTGSTGSGATEKGTYDRKIQKDWSFYGQLKGYGICRTEIALTDAQAQTWQGDRIMVGSAAATAGVIHGTTAGVDTVEASSRFVENAWVTQPSDGAVVAANGIGVFLNYPILTSGTPNAA